MRAPRSRATATRSVRMRGSNRPRPRCSTGTPCSASHCDAGSRLLEADQRSPRSAGSKRGNHQEKRRETPWMLEPATPNLSQTWRTPIGHRIRPLASGLGGVAARAVQTTAPESDRSTMRPAPTRLKARRAVPAAGRPGAKYSMKTPSRRPQPLKRDGHGLHRGCKAAPSGSRRRGGAGCAARAPPCSSRAPTIVWRARLAANASQTVPICVAVDVHGGLDGLELLARPGKPAEAGQGHEPAGDAGSEEDVGETGEDEAETERARGARPARCAHRRSPEHEGSRASDVQSSEPEDAVDRHHGQRGRGGSGQARAVADADDVASDVAGQEVVEERGHQVRRRRGGAAGRGSPGPAGAGASARSRGRAWPRRAPRRRASSNEIARRGPGEQRGEVGRGEQVGEEGEAHRDLGAEEGARFTCGCRGSRRRRCRPLPSPYQLPAVEELAVLDLEVARRLDTPPAPRSKSQWLENDARRAASPQRHPQPISSVNGPWGFAEA